jgi:hypothetical protein
LRGHLLAEQSDDRDEFAFINGTIAILVGLQHHRMRLRERKLATSRRADAECLKARQELVRLELAVPILVHGTEELLRGPLIFFISHASSTIAAASLRRPREKFFTR